MVTVPERGAANVPTNAKLWSFGSPGPHGYTTSDGVEIPNVQTATITQPYEAGRPPGAAATDWGDATSQLCQSGASCVATICA